VGDAVRLYDFASGRRLATLAAQDPSITGRVAFSRDGTRLAVIGVQSHQIHAWDLRRIRAGLASLGLDWDAPPLGSPPPDDAPTPPEPMRLEVAGATPGGLQQAERGFRLRQAAQRLRRLFAPRLNTTSEYSDRALDWARLGQPDAAYADLVVASALTNRDARQHLPLLRQIGEAQARQARWAKAAVTYGRVRELGSLDHWDAYRFALLLPQSGDLDGYRRHRKWILDHFRQTKDMAIARRLSKACLIVPLPGPDQDEALRWAMAAADESIRQQQVLPSAYLNKSLSEYRAGHIEQAVAWADKLIPKRGNGDWIFVLPARLVRSMAELQLGHRDASQWELAQAREFDRLVTPKVGSTEFGQYVVDRCICDCLFREAEKELLENGFPADPFAR
jgi:hypothetical protein